MNPCGRVAVEQIVAGNGFQKLDFQKQTKQVSGGQESTPVFDEPFRSQKSVPTERQGYEPLTGQPTAGDYYFVPDAERSSNLMARGGGKVNDVMSRLRKANGYGAAVARQEL